MKTNKEFSDSLKQTTETSKSFSSSSFSGNRWIEYCLPQLSERIEEVRDLSRSDAFYVSSIPSIDSDVVALIVIVVCLDNIKGDPVSTRKLASQIGDYLQLEVNYEFYESRNKGFLDAMQKRWPARHRAKRAIKFGYSTGYFSSDDDGLTHEDWTFEQKLTVGRVYLQPLLEMGFLESYPSARGEPLLIWSDEVTSWSEDTHEGWLYFNPAYTPLTRKPEDYVWTEKGNQNFSYPDLPPVELRLKSALTPYYKQIQLDDGDTVLAANKLASVPYRINQKVLDVVRHLFDKEIPVSSLSMTSPLPIPEIQEGATSLVVKKIKQRSHKLHLQNARTSSYRVYYQRALDVVVQYSDTDFYFLWRADARGRLYPLTSTFLSPQGDDLGKSLLQFSKGKELGAGGIKHLAIEVANRFGKDKESLADRYRWTLDNFNLIQRVALDPINFLDDWKDCDSPFMFLAAAIDYYLAITSDEPDNYVSHIPCYFDGKCSGIQHYSCLLKDEEGGKLVGLTPLKDTAKPRDVYVEVMLELIKYIHSHTEKDPDKDLYLKFWKDNTTLFNRSLTKRPTMTYVYSATPRSISYHIREWMADNKLNPNSSFKYAFYLAKVLHSKVLKKKLRGTVEGMGWLVKASQVVSKVSASIEWTTPSGFNTYQKYVKQKSSQVSVKCKALNLTVKHRVSKDTLTPDRGKQSLAIAPNYIHGLDSAHLVSVVRSFDEDITVIHDSFGCHAADSSELYYVLRKTLANQYSVDLLKQLKDTWEEKYSVELPELPKTGELDLSLSQSFLYGFT